MKRMIKFLALVMTLALMLGLAPAAALAEGGHTHTWRETSRTEPTCTQPGSVTYVCSCGEKKIEPIPALGHDWSKGEIVADELTPGGKLLRRQCWRCGEIWDEPLPADTSDDYGWEPPEEPEEPDDPVGEVSPSSGEPEGEAELVVVVSHFGFEEWIHDVGGKVVMDFSLCNTGDVNLYDPVLEMYRWDKSTGSFVLYKSFGPYYKYIIWSHLSLSLYYYDYVLEDWDLENAEDGLGKMQFIARATTKEGQPVESEPVIYSFPVFDSSLLLEAEDCSAGQTPEDGYVKVNLKVTSIGTETFSFEYSSSQGLDADGHVCKCDDELHNYDLSWLAPGNPEEAELWIKVTELDVEAGEVRRDVSLTFLRWHREDGGTVFPSTADPILGGGGWAGVETYATNWVEIVIPLPKPPEEPAPAPEPPTSCTPALTGLGDGTAEWNLERCPDHANLAREAENKTPEEALALWTAALDAAYDEWLAEADEAQRPAIEAERAAFMEQLAAYGAGCELRGGKEYAAKKMTELLMHKVSLLCFARETSAEDWAALFAGAEELDATPEQPLCLRESHDSVMGLKVWETLCPEHAQIAPAAEDEEGWRELKTLWLAALNTETDEQWLAVDAEGRELIAAERQSFGRWLAAWEALLTARYPEDPALVQQLLTEAVRARTVDLCG